MKNLLLGESKNIEYKSVLPEKSDRYIKTVIAFANTQGGKLIIGVDDKTRHVIGIDQDCLFPLMDTISNTIADSCQPQIIPDIEPLTIDGRTVIIVNVEAGKNRPYYLKSKGKEKGTYIRMAGTSRLAYPEKIRELEMEGLHISWDELICIGYPVRLDAIQSLCEDIERFRNQSELPKRTIKKEHLVNWHLLKENENELIATNAFALLTSDYFSFSKTQCAVFKGTTRDVFLDKREYTGPIYNQIEEAIHFVLRNIRLGATIEGLVRKEEYELPVNAIREMIINAHCHRNLQDSSCVQIAIYDDRLEVTSPGGLYNGLTYEQVLTGHSKIRNKVIANVFNQMGLVESWGSGISRIMNEAKRYGLPQPKIQEYDDMFRVNLYRLVYTQNDERPEVSEKHRKSIGETTEKHRNIVREEIQSYDINVLNPTQQEIIRYLSENNRLSAVKLAEKIGISSRNIENNIKKLKEFGILVRHGSFKSGYWEVKNIQNLLNNE